MTLTNPQQEVKGWEVEFFESFVAVKEYNGRDGKTIYRKEFANEIDLPFKVYDFISNLLEADRKAIREKVEGMKKERQFPLAKEVKDRIYDCDVNAYNQALEDILNSL